MIAVFLSTPSARRATQLQRDRPVRARHFYPRPPRGGRLFHDVFPFSAYKISIHALREEGDVGAQGIFAIRLAISIHALREEGDHYETALESPKEDISIHALREEGDDEKKVEPFHLRDFYPRPP